MNEDSDFFHFFTHLMNVVLINAMISLTTATILLTYS